MFNVRLRNRNHDGICRTCMKISPNGGFIKRGTPNHLCLVGFSDINHPFWGISVSPFMETPKFCWSPKLTAVTSLGFRTAEILRTNWDAGRGPGPRNHAQSLRLLKLGKIFRNLWSWFMKLGLRFMKLGKLVFDVSKIRVMVGWDYLWRWLSHISCWFVVSPKDSWWVFTFFSRWAKSKNRKGHKQQIVWFRTCQTVGFLVDFCCNIQFDGSIKQQTQLRGPCWHPRASCLARPDSSCWNWKTETCLYQILYYPLKR